MDIEEYQRNVGSEVLLKVLILNAVGNEGLVVVDYAGTQFYASLSDLTAKEKIG